MMKSSFLLGSVAFALLAVGCKTSPQSETAPSDMEALSPQALASSHGRIDFVTHVKPVLQAKCIECHNRKTLPFFSMETRALAFKAGGQGPRIVPHHPEQSKLIINGTMDHARTMPPVGNRLTENEKRILTAWVKQGAEWPAGAAGALHPAN